MAATDHRSWRNLCRAFHKSALYGADNYYERTARSMREFQDELEGCEARRFALAHEGAGVLQQCTEAAYRFLISNYP